jgi:hypothetical protein
MKPRWGFHKVIDYTFPEGENIASVEAVLQKRNIINPIQGLVCEQLFILSGLYPDL